jgi:cytochrome b561
VIRLLWRWINPVPAMPADLKRWEVIAAKSGHAGLYVLLFTASITGWGLAGTFRNPMRLDLFGLPIPQIVSDRALHDFFEESHTIASYLLAALVVVHIAGSLRHHLVKRNDVMRRMWFGSAAGQHAGAAAPPVSVKNADS